jgi:hypothetical protein
MGSRGRRSGLLFVGSALEPHNSIGLVHVGAGPVAEADMGPNGLAFRPLVTSISTFYFDFTTIPRECSNLHSAILRYRVNFPFTLASLTVLEQLLMAMV